jgi:hypothetical protein
MLTGTLVPQLACFMPGDAITKPEMDCCKDMTGDCTGTNMSHPCCQMVVRSEIGVAAKVIKNATPDFSMTDGATDISAAVSGSGYQKGPIHDIHAPPPVTIGSSSVLRI